MLQETWPTRRISSNSQSTELTLPPGAHNQLPQLSRRGRNEYHLQPLPSYTGDCSPEWQEHAQHGDHWYRTLRGTPLQWIRFTPESFSLTYSTPTVL